MSDDDLVAAWVRGEQSAGKRLFERYFVRIVRFFRSKVDQGAEDLVQRTFLALLQSRARFRGGSFRAFVFAVAHNVLREHLREKTRDTRLDFGTVSLRDLGPGPSTWLGQHNERRRLLDALRNLPLDDQVALELYYVERLKAGEIAVALEISEGGVRSRLRRAKTRLRAGLEAEKRVERPNDGVRVDPVAC